MRIQSTDILAGQPILKIRSLFKQAQKGSLSSIAESLKVDQITAQTIYNKLIDEGYIEPSEEAHPFLDWQTTIKGNALANAKARKPIKRDTAKKLVQEFLDRVQEINANAEYAYYVKRVIIFGSYLSDSATLGDIDLAITLEMQYTDPTKRHDQFEKRIQHAIDQGRNFKNIVEQYGWPQIEIHKILKGGLASISLHDAKAEKDFFKSAPFNIIFEANI